MTDVSLPIKNEALLTKPLSEFTVQELQGMMIRLSTKEAKQWIAHSQKVRAKIIAQGRCPECGDKAHKSGKCPLKIQSDTELIAENKRR